MTPPQSKTIAKLPLPEFFKNAYQKFGHLTPIQDKAVTAGLLEHKSILACAPTASGKTLVATMAIANTLGRGKALYLVPLKALANEKYKEFRKLLEETPYKCSVAIGDIEAPAPYLAQSDLIVLTTEKLDSLMRHQVSWLSEIKTVVIDEIHLLNDPSRGPTLEIILTLLKIQIKPQLVGLSATIGNPKELADWLEATLVQDNWRPVKLKQGIALQGDIEFFEKE